MKLLFFAIFTLSILMGPAVNSPKARGSAKTDILLPISQPVVVRFDIVKPVDIVPLNSTNKPTIYPNLGGFIVYKDKFIEAINKHNSDLIAKQKQEAKDKADAEAARLKAIADAQAAEAAKVVTYTPPPPQPVKVTVTPIKTYSGNTYTWGNCTWYVKNRRPDIPDTWHNANQWLGFAQAEGWPTGLTPKVGAVAWFKNYGHVAIVTGIGIGTVTVDEMNYKGLDVIDSRVVSLSEVEFIY